MILKLDEVQNTIQIFKFHFVFIFMNEFFLFISSANLNGRQKERERERERKEEKFIQFVYETRSFIALSLAFRNGFRDFLMVQVFFEFFYTKRQEMIKIRLK